TVDGLTHGERDGEGARHRLGELQAQHDGPLFSYVLRLVHAVRAQQLVELRAVESAVRALEIRVLGNGAGEKGSGARKAELAPPLIYRGLRDEPAEHALVDPERAGL